MVGSRPEGTYRLRSPGRTVLEGPAPSDGEGGEDVEADQAHAGHGHRGSGRERSGRSTRRGRAAGSARRRRPPGSSFQVCPEVSTTWSTLRVSPLSSSTASRPCERRRDVDGRRVVADDLEVRRGVGHQGVVEPDQVLAHQPAGQVVGGQDRVAPGADPALVTHPAVAAADRPLRAGPRRRGAGRLRRGRRRGRADRRRC